MHRPGPKRGEKKAPNTFESLKKNTNVLKRLGTGPSCSLTSPSAEHKLLPIAAHRVSHTREEEPSNNPHFTPTHLHTSIKGPQRGAPQMDEVESVSPD